MTTATLTADPRPKSVTPDRPAPSRLSALGTLTARRLSLSAALFKGRFDRGPAKTRKEDG